MIIASIDIGSNTVLMLIAEVEPGTEKINPLKDVQRIPRISEGLTQTGMINDQSSSRLLSVLREYFNLIQNYGCDKILISGTSAFRKSSNGSVLKSKIETKFQSELRVLTGEDEAELAFLGTSDYGKSDENRLVIDIGGGSTEIIYGNDKKNQFRRSFDIGVVSLSEKYSNKNESLELKTALLGRKFKNEFLMLPELLYAPAKTLALAGTPVTLTSIYKGMREYDEHEIEGFILSKNNILELFRYLSKFTPAELLDMYPLLIKNREDLILSGTSILLYLMNILKIPEVIVSTRGIRYGAVIQYLRQAR